MLIYLLRRTALALLFVLLVASLALVIVRLAPGDYAADLFGVGADPALVAATRATYGLDRPILEQYAGWLGHAARFDFGTSLLYRRPVADLVVQRAANTAILAITALAIATLAGLPLGVLAGSRRGTGPTVVRGASIFFLSVPPMLLSLLLVFIAARTGWLPVGGMTSSAIDSGFGIGDSGLGIRGLGFEVRAWVAWARDVAWHLPVPALALALPVGAMLERLLAQSMAETIRAPFIVAAESRGLSRARLVWRHAFRIALQPVIAIYGLIVGTLLSGSFMVEIITAWPGLGRLTYDALRGRDVYLVAGCAAAGAVFLAIGSVMSDVAQAAIDPRVRER
ncbi:MAG: ABC transporter permease [Vicinamibacterales bacterium]